MTSARFVVGIELQDLREGRHRAVDESAAPVVEAEAQQHVGVFERAEPRRAAAAPGVPGSARPTWPFSRYRLPEDQPELERVRVERGGLLELFDGQVDLAGDQVVQAEDEVRRLPHASPVDPPALAELVAFPGLAGGQPDEQRDEHARRRP